MSRTFHHQRGERRIRARAIRHDPPDHRRLARTFIALAVTQAEAEAQALAEDTARKSTKKAKTATRRDTAVTAEAARAEKERA